MASTAGEKLAALRAAKGWGHRELAERVDVSVSTVWRWEQRRFNPEREELERLADALDVRSGYLSDRDLPEFANKGPWQIAAAESLRMFLDELEPAARQRAARYSHAAELEIAPRTRADWHRFHSL